MLTLDLVVFTGDHRVNLQKNSFSNILEEKYIEISFACDSFSSFTQVNKSNYLINCSPKCELVT